MDHRQAAADGFRRHIAENPYPGRGLVLGRTDGGGFRILYWIMGRSANSRNRRFEVDGGRLRTAPADVSRLEDPSLVIYEAMLEFPGVQIVSNGDQTRTVLDELEAGGTFAAALERREREPDAPNYTPRITGMIDFRPRTPEMSLSILRAGAFDPARTDRVLFRPALPPAGFGLALTTYTGNGEPLPSYVGDPMILPCEGSTDEVLERYWSALDADNRISLAVRDVGPDGVTERIAIKSRNE